MKRNNLPKFENCYSPPVIDLSQSAGKMDTAIFIHTGLQYCSRPSPVPKSTENISSCAVVVKLCDSLTLNVASIYLQRGPDELNTEWIKSPQDGHDKWLIQVIGGAFNAHSPFWKKGCLHVTSNRFVENIVDSSLYVLNDGSFTIIQYQLIGRLQLIYQ